MSDKGLPVYMRLWTAIFFISTGLALMSSLSKSEQLIDISMIIFAMIFLFIGAGYLIRDYDKSLRDGR